MRISLCRVHWGQWRCTKDFLLFVGLSLFLATDLLASAGLEHFYWGAVPPSVQAEGPFFVTLRARSLDSSSFTNFNGTVRVTELIPAQSLGLLITEIQTINTNRVELSDVSATPIGVSGWRIVFYDRTSWPAPKMAFTVPAGTVCSGYGVFEVRGSAFFPGTIPFSMLGSLLLGRPAPSTILTRCCCWMPKVR